MSFGKRGLRVSMVSGAVLAAMLALPAAVSAKPTMSYQIAPQPLDTALRDFGVQSGVTILADAALTKGKSTPGFVAVSDPETALRALLQGSGLSYQHQGNVFVIRPAAAPAAEVGNGQSAAGAQSQLTNDASTQDIIVTAQKRKERIQDVPIAISAFSGKKLDQLKIESGSELLRAIPNVTFSKNNFSGYNFSIRGIGTKAVSVTTDPAVAVSYNNVPLIRNRLFEQEYLDVERVEVLRGPQGTLYGRNATGGVVNMITNKPVLSKFEEQVKGEVGNFASRRVSGFVNIPLTDTLAVRVAGAATHRDGYDYNSVTDHNVNGRNLWQTRASVRWEPESRTTIDFVWEHFQERDDRSRTGKQLCHRDPGPTEVGGVAITDPTVQGQLSQGCQPGSLYDDSAYGTPNGLSLPLVLAGSLVYLGTKPDPNNPFAPTQVTLLQPGVDPYGGMMQSRNLREIASVFDPRFHAKNDVFELNIQHDLPGNLQLFSQTAYTTDTYYSAQDYNRFNTVPIFSSSTGLNDLFGNPITAPGLAPGGIFTDPQLGASNRFLAVDENDAKSSQWYQELRLQSSFTGPMNFSLGANYLHYKTAENYYVFFNTATAIAQGLFQGGNSLETGGPGVQPCPLPSGDPCAYVDPNPLSKINGDGHNYFRSQNPYVVNSEAVFGEVYYEITHDVKLTGGLRFTDDHKRFTPYPSQLLLSTVPIVGAGFVDQGYYAEPAIKQGWQELTGKFGIDWKPQLSFTDQTLLYASYSRGYKGGGANPPGIGADPQSLRFAPQPSTFKPEFVNAFELGSKNTLLNGHLTFDLSAFLYDYHDYQVSKIIDRTALNENFDATMYGLELESTWHPSRSFDMSVNVGYLHTRLADGSKSIDVLNRTQGNPDWTLVKPYFQLASNCVAPTKDVAAILSSPFNTPGGFTPFALEALCGGSYLGSFVPGATGTLDLPALYGFTYDPVTDGPNQGQGFYADVGGNELPNSPHLTASIAADYTLFFGSWQATLHGDFYHQTKSFARIYNTAADRLRGWSNANVSFTIGRPQSGLAIQAYVKNVFDKTPITDAFVNSDDSGLTTNVFTLDPRIFGVNVTKSF